MLLNRCLFSFGFNAHKRNETAAKPKNGSPSDIVGGWEGSRHPAGGGMPSDQIFPKKGCCGGVERGD